MSNESKLQSDTITVSVSRKVLPGKETAYEKWISDITVVAANFPGRMGINVLRPNDSQNGRYIIIYRFDNYENDNRWEESAERAEWISRLDGLVEGSAETKKVSGLEFWFDLPSVPLTAKPLQWRMAILGTLVVYILVLFLSTILNPVLDIYPFSARLLVVIPIQVLLMTFVITPRMTRLFKNWIYPDLS